MLKSMAFIVSFVLIGCTSVEMPLQSTSKIDVDSVDMKERDEALSYDDTRY